ncbi:phenazine biosynthesis protein PhzF [Actinocatenispora thailandica]|uniref:Phenazine biosynthesis protein PhzF n=1 Tax=Actinocatenispora thailandica TaxID=227318 RepID=A0A7R7HVF1_9ACTN|nr:phenazine biosynthesis protein PhzF [Actinocatenispora thailandica]
MHVNVFSARPYQGNSLPVFPDIPPLSSAQLRTVTRELRQFEAVFLRPTDRADTAHARVFDQHGELPFAGHPLLGAAAVLHHRSAGAPERRWQLELVGRTVEVTTTRSGPEVYSATIDQGRPEFLGEVTGHREIAEAFALGPADLRSDLPLEVVSTGLRYLVVPVVSGALARARIHADIGAMLRAHGAQFAVLFDEDGAEIRHWDNDGTVEDIATGSAAGVIGGYRLRHGLAGDDVSFALSQGRFTGRSARLTVRARGSRHDVRAVRVSGDVVLLGTASLAVPPTADDAAARS